jgi:hypothetical protein
MILDKVPSVVTALAEKVNMTPIAWKITSTSITIVFEQGPKMIFNRDQVLDAVEPVIHNMEDAMKFVKAAEGGRVVGDHSKLLPKRKPRK